MVKLSDLLNVLQNDTKVILRVYKCGTTFESTVFKAEDLDKDNMHSISVKNIVTLASTMLIEIEDMDE